MPNPSIGRDVLTQFLPNHQAIKAFERVLDDVSTSLPDLISDATNAADSAGATAANAVAVLQQIAGALDALLMAPAPTPPTYADDFTRATYTGTLAAQDYDHVDITGGTAGLDSGAVGAPSLYLNGEKATGLYRIGADHWGMAIAGVKLVDYSAGVFGITGNITATGDVSAAGQVKSSIATGTAPLVVTSTTMVANLYVARAALADVATLANTATIANGLSSPTTFPPDATDLPSVITLANALKAAGNTKGL